jgi:hypothetical protein
MNWKRIAKWLGGAVAVAAPLAATAYCRSDACGTAVSAALKALGVE